MNPQIMLNECSDFQQKQVLISSVVHTFLNPFHVTTILPSSLFSLVLTVSGHLILFPFNQNLRLREQGPPVVSAI